MQVESSCPSSGTVSVPYSVLLSNGLYGIMMLLYCVFVTYLLVSQSLRPATKSDNKALSESQHGDSKESQGKETTQVDSTEPARANGASQEAKSKRKYRIEQEQTKGQSSEYTRRGMLWSSHASWHLPSAPRQTPQTRDLDPQGLEHIIDLLRKYDVDPVRGFLPQQDPLQRLPYARYHLWEDIGDDLSKLLGARLGQVRDPLRQLPVLNTDKLVTEAELRRAHLLLCLFAHAYIWGGPEPLDHIPEGIAKPLWEVSEKLGLPPVLGHPSIVLYNWRRLDTEGDICMENLTTLNNFFDGRDESWFYLITVEIESRGAAAVVPMMLAIDAVERFNEEKLQVTQRYDMSSRGSSLAPGDANVMQRYLSAQRSLTAHSSRSLHGSRFRKLQGNQTSRTVSEGIHGSATGEQSSSRYLSLHRDRRDPSELSDMPGRLRTGLNDSRYTSVGSTGLASALRRPLHMDEDDETVFERALVGELTPIQVAKFVTYQLSKVAAAIKEMCLSLDCMREGCHPFIFYHRVRPFLSGWKDNPILPQGVVYRGVSDEPKQFYGGSAAQSSLIPFLDITLGLSHSHTKSQEFLLKMRDYMPRLHRQFLEYLNTVSCIRAFVLELMPADHSIGPEGKVQGPASTTNITATDDSNKSEMASAPKADIPTPAPTPTPAAASSDSETGATVDDGTEDAITPIANNSGHSNLRRSRNPARSSISTIRASMGIDPAKTKNQKEINAIAALTRENSEQQGELLFSPSQLDLAQLEARYSPPATKTMIDKTPSPAVGTSVDDDHSKALDHATKKLHAKRLVEENVWLELRDTYNDCVSNLQRFRSGHINLVAEYIIAQQKKGVAKNSLEGSAGGKGTGGTDLMKFLKPIRDNCESSLIKESPAGLEEKTVDDSQLVDLSCVSEEDEQSVRSAILSRAHSRATTFKLPAVSTTAAEQAVGWKEGDESLFAKPYAKDNAGSEDIDFFHAGQSDFEPTSLIFSSNNGNSTSARDPSSHIGGQNSSSSSGVGGITGGGGKTSVSFAVADRSPVASLPLTGSGTQGSSRVKVSPREPPPLPQVSPRDPSQKTTHFDDGEALWRPT